MIFVTFFGCCFGIALMAAGLSTKWWFEAEAQLLRANAEGLMEKRPNSSGHVNFGLFKGRKALNFGYGVRINPINVTEMVLNEQPVFMDQGLWLATIVCLCFAMLWAIVGALFAVINTATTPVEWITGVGGLYVWNILAVIFNVVSVSCWAAQFHLHLVSNVLLYDADANWTTEGQEKFGYSYWLVVVAIFIHIANIIIIYTGTSEPKQKQQLEAPDTKAGNIMLY